MMLTMAGQQCPKTKPTSTTRTIVTSLEQYSTTQSRGVTAVNHAHNPSCSVASVRCVSHSALLYKAAYPNHFMLREARYIFPLFYTPFNICQAADIWLLRAMPAIPLLFCFHEVSTSRTGQVGVIVFLGGIWFEGCACERMN